MPDMKIFTKNWISAITIFIFLSPTCLWSAPREVTFFPDSAQVVDVVKVKVQADSNNLRRAILVLPGQADPDSFVFRLSKDSKIKIDDIAWRQIVRQDDEKIAEIRKQLDKLKDDRKRLQSTIRALDTQIQFWQLQTKAKVKTITDAYNMSAAIGKNIQKSYQEKLSKESELEKLDKQIKEKQEALDSAAGKKETAWEVAILLSGTRNSEETLQYTYSLAGCGWQPLYRLEANSRDKQITFTWEAEIWQSSGQDWNNVSTNLATLKPPPSVAPTDLPPWIIKPRQVFRNKSKRQAMKADIAEAQEEVAGAAEAPSPAPRQTRQGTYSLWQIGKKNIPAGLKQRVKIQDEIWPSEFTYLARPSQSSQVFVRALVKFAEPKEIPSGNSLFVVDGAILGKRDFMLAGQEATIFFGIDPLVAAKTQLLSRKSGEKTLLQNKQTYTWDWRIDIENSRPSPIKIIVEEPNPQPRDERISLSLKNEPDPAEQAPSSLIWNLDVPAGQKKSIFTSVRIEAPKNMILDLGWR